MPRFYVLSGADIGTQSELKAGQAIGRSADCALVLHDASVSRVHARVEPRGSAWFLVDAGSRNGIYLQGSRQSEIELTDGLELRLGEVDLRVRLPKDAVQVPVQSKVQPAFDGEEIELEEELEPVAPKLAAAAPVSPRGPAAPAAPTAPAANTHPAAPTATARKPIGGVQTKDRGILQYSKVENRGGLLQSDLAQAPWYMRLGLILGALLVFALLGFFAFRATQFFKQKTAGEPIPEETEAQPR
jgi:hypothetical protein